MPDITMPILLGFCALVCSLLLTPLVRHCSLRMGLVDTPDGKRKFHAKRIPRVGGIAVFGAYFLTLSIACLVSSSRFKALPGGWWLAASVAIVFATGLIDDLVGLTPAQKVMGQLAAAILAWQGGVQIHVLDGWVFGSYISLPLTVVWLILCANAFNLIDGLDGLATGVSLFATLTVLAAAVISRNSVLILVSIPLAGSLLGFLRYNFNPASIFLGDCGSLTLGFLLGCFGALWSQKTNTLLGLSAPVMAFSLPLIDTCLSIVRRALRYQPIFAGDRGHIHHRLLDQGKSTRRVAVLLYGICVLAAIFSLLQQSFHQQFGIFVVIAFALASWAGIHHLGYLELTFFRRFFVTGTVFRQIDDQIRLEMLERTLSRTYSTDEAIELINETCNDLGFENVSLLFAGEKRDLLSIAGECHISIPLGEEYTLILNGISRIARPVAIPQLSQIIIDHFESRAFVSTETANVAAELPLLVQAIHG